MLAKAEALLPTAASNCGLNWWALLASEANAAAFALMAEKTRGSAEIAFIAALSLASCWNAGAFLAKRASAAALDAASRNALALLAKLLNADALERIAASAC